MRQGKQQWLYYLIAIAMILLSWYTWRNVALIHDNHEKQRRNFYFALQEQQRVVQDIHYLAGKASVAHAERQDAFLQLQKATYSIRENVFIKSHTALPHVWEDAFEFEAFWQDTEAYAQHLMHQDKGLSPIQKENLERIQQRAKLIEDYLASTLEEKDQISWRELSSKEHAQAVIQRYYDWQEQFQDIPAIGAGDFAFIHKQAEKNDRIVNIFSHEPPFPDKRIMDDAADFMQPIMKQNIIPKIDSTGELHEFGELRTVAFEESTYTVQFSKQGGHLLFVNGTSQKSNEVSEEEVKKAALKVANNWQVEKLHLEDYKQDATNNWLFTFVPFHENVVMLNRPLYIELNRSGELVKLNAADYYLNQYEATKGVTFTPKLTKEEAVATLRAPLEKNGDVRLAVIRYKQAEQLVYDIPVQGVSGVEHVYIDAMDGSILKMEYETH